MASSTDIQGRIDHLRAEWVTTYNDGNVDKAGIERLSQIDKELEDLKAELDDAQKLEARAAQLREEAVATAKSSKNYGNVKMGGSLTAIDTPKAATLDVDIKSLVKSAEWSPRKGAGMGLKLTMTEAEYKTLVQLSVIAPATPRLPGFQSAAVEERSVLDLIPQGAMDTPNLQYTREGTLTNAATMVAEGGTKPEAAFTFTNVTVTASKVAVWVPVTDEALEDNAFLDAYIRDRLLFMVRRREEAQVLAGDGLGSNLTGILNTTGIQTQAKGTDPTLTALYNAITKVRVTGFAEPTAIVMHPNDWSAIVTTQAGDGSFFMFATLQGDAAQQLFGLPIRLTTEGIAENTALVGAFRPHSQIFRRSEAAVAVSTEHSTFFVENKVAIRAESRLALAVYRPAAFCTVTGI